MNYTHFTIRNFRCYSEEQKLIFGQPNIDNPGSGITYIVGENNSGKTTLIESLWIKKGHYLNDSERKQHPPEFNLYNGNDLIKTIRLLRNNAYLFIEEPEQDNESLFEVVSSRRHWDSAASPTRSSKDVILASALGENPRRQQNIETAVFLKDIEKNAKKYEDFTLLVQKVIPGFSNWAVGYENHPYIKYLSSDGVSHKADFLGDGVISIIRILAHLFEKRSTGLIIDEPELSLHPLAQKNLIKLIAEYAKERQIIISTHSPYFISWEYIEKGAVLNRVVKSSDTTSKIYTLREFEKYKKLVKGGNWQQPYLMDVVSKEIFFQENILFVEGQEDVGLLRNFFNEENISFFGYGVRGYTNFELALAIAEDLGIEKACVIIDSPSVMSSKLEYNENFVREALKKYEPKYKIIQWKKSDIRDKLGFNQQVEKNGYFTNEGELKKEDELDDFYEKINDVKAYFKVHD